MNPFSTSYELDTPDNILVSEILEGNKSSLNGLILRHQPFIYNIAWKMMGDPIKAEDLTQEALLKIISNLSNFQSNSFISHLGVPYCSQPLFKRSEETA